MRAAAPAVQGSAEAAAARAGGREPEAAAKPEPAGWIGRLLKALGVEHERQLSRPAERGPGHELPLPQRISAGEPTPAANHPGPQAAGPDGDKTADTLKGLLLQLSAESQAPSEVKEGARQLAQQITGQQLLLTPDRAGMFSHVTLMLPLIQENGSQTASIHIQSRKGQRGDLDSSNCRLFFDLNMRTLGNTLVDVQVTDKIVSLRVHNDQPYIAALLDAHRDEIASGLQQAGYQFLSLKCLPYPEAATAAGSLGDAGAQSQAHAHAQSKPSPGFYEPKPYKGVDIRV